MNYSRIIKGDKDFLKKKGKKLEKGKERKKIKKNKMSSTPV